MINFNYGFPSSLALSFLSMKVGLLVIISRMKKTVCWSERPSSICESFLGFMSAKKHLQTVGVLTFSPHKQTEALLAKNTIEEIKKVFTRLIIYLTLVTLACLLHIWFGLIEIMRQYFRCCWTTLHIRDGLHICKVSRDTPYLAWCGLMLFKNERLSFRVCFQMLFICPGNHQWAEYTK